MSWYLRGLVGMALLTAVSPMIAVSVPVLVLLGPSDSQRFRTRTNTLHP